MKAILRKGAVACAAMLMGTNVMAQSFDLNKEFEGDYWPSVINQSLTKDGNPRLMVAERTSNDFYSDMDRNYFQLNKLSILNNALATEKEFTSGPLFEEIEDIKVTYAPKTLKIASVDTLYSGEEALRNFYRNFDEPNYPNGTGYSMYEQMLEKCNETQINYYVESYIARMYEIESTYEGYRLVFDDSNVMKSDYYEWGTQYPESGWIYKSHDNICQVRFNYIHDELAELERQSGKASLFYVADIEYFDYTVDSECNAVITQSLFNDDDKYEFLLPEFAVFETTQENWNGTLVTTTYNKPIGYKIVSEDGVTLHSLIINAEKDPDMRCYASVTSIGDKNYLLVDYYSYSSDYEVARFYEIKKDGTGIEKVREMRGSMNIRPTVANRDEQITITLNDENSNAARELIITGVNGQLVDRRDIPAGENTVTVSAAMMRSGMYNFTLQKKGEIVDNGKVIVK